MGYKQWDVTNMWCTCICSTVFQLGLISVYSVALHRLQLAWWYPIEEQVLVIVVSVNAVNMIIIGLPSRLGCPNHACIFCSNLIMNTSSSQWYRPNDNHTWTGSWTYLYILTVCVGVCASMSMCVCEFLFLYVHVTNEAWCWLRHVLHIGWPFNIYMYMYM